MRGWHRMQALAGTYVWDWEALRAELPALATAWLADHEGDMIGPGIAIDETAHLKNGDATACVASQHAGCTGQVGIGQAGGDQTSHIALGWGQARPAERGPPARTPSPAGHHGGLLDAEPGTAFPRGLRLFAEMLAARRDPARDPVCFHRPPGWASWWCSPILVLAGQMSEGEAACWSRSRASRSPKSVSTLGYFFPPRCAS
jgi:hypothetical protein